MKKYEFYWKFFERPKRYFRSLIEKLLGLDTNAKIFQRIANKYRGQLMLNDFEVVRLIGWTDQYEDDYYWIYLHRVKGKGNIISLLSCVGNFTKLKGKLTKFQYYNIDHIWDINDCSYKQGIKIAKQQNIIVK